tara:strand:+ start:164 stop:358 length:195 start_codon:yes stop_codon:yes gene_type:complete
MVFELIFSHSFTKILHAALTIGNQIIKILLNLFDEKLGLESCALFKDTRKRGGGEYRFGYPPVF